MSLGLKDLDITERIFEVEYSSGESIIFSSDSEQSITQEKNISQASFCITDQRSCDLLKDLLTNATG